MIAAVVSLGRGHHGPGYFLSLGIAFVVIFTPFVIAPNALRTLNSWLAKFAWVRARARSGTGSTGEMASDQRIRIVCGIAAAAGAAMIIFSVIALAT